MTTTTPRPPEGDWLGTPYLHFTREGPFGVCTLDRPEARNAVDQFWPDGRSKSDARDATVVRDDFELPICAFGGSFESIHAAVNQRICDLRSALYRDFPDPHRVRGREKF